MAKNNLIVVKLQGGLGNQMFQYAAAKALSVKKNCPLLIDLSFLEQTALQQKDGFTSRYYELGIFKNIEQHFASSEKIKAFYNASVMQKLQKRLGLFFPKIFTEKAFEFNKDFFLQKPPVLLNGYWQSEKYFMNCAAAIKDAFQFPALPAGDINRNLLNNITNTLSVSVHVRRGDYLHPSIHAQHGTCSAAYYQKAIGNLQVRFPAAVFYVFTDDVAWVEANITSQLSNCVLIQNNKANDSWKDMYLMSCCKHNIIANSSFSWWGAWLNNNESKMVIAPARWFNSEARNASDIIPAAWVKV